MYCINDFNIIVILQHPVCNNWLDIVILPGQIRDSNHWEAYEADAWLKTPTMEMQTQKVKFVSYYYVAA